MDTSDTCVDDVFIFLFCKIEALGSTDTLRKCSISLLRKNLRFGDEHFGGS